MAKIAIDAGHGGSDPGAVYENRQEKDDTLKLAMAVGKLLEEQGFDVTYTRTSDEYDSPYQKAVIANRAGVDYLVSLHRNAMPVPGSAEGIETLVFRNNTTASHLANDINSQLEKVGFKNRGVIERPNLAILRRSQMPAVLVEAGFIDNPKDNKIFDEKFQDIAKAIASGITTFIRSNPNTGNDSENETSPLLYRVQVGAYRNSSLAEQLNRQLTTEGYPSFVIYEDGLYKVQVGAFSQLDNAIRMEQRLRRNGYQTFLTT